MEYDRSDTSGTDDDLPPHQNRFQKGGRVSGNGRAAIGAFSRMQNDMETQIHRIEQEAYSSVLRAFKAQSDAISWDKESLITELRKELRVSDEEHRELLSRVNADELLHRIREWRKAGGHHNGLQSDALPSPSVSGSRKKQRPSQLIVPFGGAPPLHPNLQSSSSFKRASLPGTRGKRQRPYSSAGIMGRGQIANRGSSDVCLANESIEALNVDTLVGRRVWTRWPDDNNFYEAVITDYNEGRHALVYDINTVKETWEWVNLKEISHDDIRWEGEDPGIPQRSGRGGHGRGMKKSMPRGGGAGRGRGTGRKGLPQLQNGNKYHGDIEILHTDTLIKEVEKVIGAAQVDHAEIEKAKSVLKEHEQALVDAIARLEDASDGESDKGEPGSRIQALGKRQIDEVLGERQYDSPHDH